MIYKINLKNDKSIEIYIEGRMANIKFQDYTLFYDSSLEGLNILNRMLEKALNNELEISSELKSTSLGLWWNDYTESYEDEEIEEEDLVEKFWVWSTRYVQSWIFNDKGKIYIEISKSYPWHFVQPKRDEKFTSYQEFRSTFEPITIIEIPPKQAEKIIDECTRLIEKISTL